MTLRDMDRIPDAIALLNEGIERLPESWILYRVLGNCYQLAAGGGTISSDGPVAVPRIGEEPPEAKLGVALQYLSKNKPHEAMELLRQALAQRPDFAPALYHLGTVQQDLGQTEEALATYLRLVQMDPTYSRAYRPAGMLLAAAGRLPEAIKLLGQGNELHPENADIANDLAWWMATAENEEIRDASTAVELAESANKLCQGRRPHILDTLAAAYAEDGRFDMAIQTARRALSLAEEQDTDLADGIRGRIELYKAHKPYRTQ
jgi:tetratricopeptide (TPR) repeat protein